MELSNQKDTVHITIVDLLAFKLAVAASSSLANARLLGFYIDGYTEIPSFKIEIGNETITAFVSGIAGSEHSHESVIIYYFMLGKDDTCCYALAFPSVDDGSDEWLCGPIIATDDLNASPQFSELAMSDQLKQLEA